MAIKVVTDSTAYLPADYVAQHDIRIVPLKVLFGHRAYREGTELSNGEFYRMLAESPDLPTTSQPSVGDFQSVYADLVSQDHEIISIHISSKLSGTVQSARAAANLLPHARIHIVDSQYTSLGLEMMIRRTVAALSQGHDTAYVLNRLETMKRNMELLFVVDTLEYLEKGGRIGGARAFLGTLLKIKPVLKLQNGVVEAFAMVRTKRKAITFLFEHLAAVARGQRVYGAVAHAQTPADMAELERLMREHLNCEEVYTPEIGPVIGTHAGPGVVGAAICPVDSAP